MDPLCVFIVAYVLSAALAYAALFPQLRYEYGLRPIGSSLELELQA